MPIFLKIIEKIKSKALPILPVKILNYIHKYKSLSKFFVSGIIAGGSDLILLFIFHGVLKIEIVLATSLAFIFSFIISFSLQKYWTFSNHDQKKVYKQFALYLTIAFINLSINGWLMHILVNKYSVWYLLAQVISSGSIAIESFIVYKFIIFKNKLKGNEINNQSRSLN